MEVINQVNEFGRQIADLGILIVIAAIFLVAVIIGGTALMKKTFQLYDSQIQWTAQLVTALKASEMATQQNTEVYKDTKLIHEKLNGDVEEIKGELNKVREQLDDLLERFEQQESDRKALREAIKELTHKYDSIFDKLLRTRGA